MTIDLCTTASGFPSLGLGAAFPALYVLADCFDASDFDEDVLDPIEDEHHAIFECSAYATTRHMFPDLFPSHVSTVSQFLNQPDCNRLAKIFDLDEDVAPEHSLG